MPIPGFEAKRLAKDGSIFNVWVTVSVLYAEGHHRELIAFTERDIRSRRLVENNDCVSCMQRLTAMVMDTHAAIILLDTKGKITAWNQGAEKLYGWQEREMVNTNIIDLVSAREQASTRTKIADLASGEAIQHHLQVHSLTKGGHEIAVSFSASAVNNHNGEALLIVMAEWQP